METTSLEKFYTFAYDLQFSPCGQYLAVCDNYGFITLFSIAKALDPAAVGCAQKCINKWRGDQSSVYCLASNKEHLFSGGTEGVRCWRWSAITNLQKNLEKPEPVCHVMPPPTAMQSNEFSDVNDLFVDDKKNILYIACGVGVFCWDLNSESLSAVYSGHSKYIHSICLRPGTNEFLTGSEDGTVKVWDPMQSEDAIHTITVGKKANTNWVSSVSVDSSGEWMVIGGSTPPTLYKLGLLKPIAVFDVPEKTSTSVAMFTCGQIITGGSESVVRHWKMNGEALMSVPCSLSHVLSIAHNTCNRQYEVLAVGGDSASVDIFTNFGYKAFSLSV